jgi:HlyD family secretion protein
MWMFVFRPGRGVHRVRIVTLSLTALALAACGKPAPKGWREELVSRADVVEAVSATGQVGALVTVSVGTQVSGTVARLHADFNAVVRKGQLLAELDPRLFQAALARADAALVAALADVDRARVQLTDAVRTRSRVESLVASKLSSQAEFDTALTAEAAASAGVKAAEARVKLARAERETAATNLSLCRITSPIDGLVISRSVDVGQTVAASLQAPVLFTIANDLSAMQVLANIDEADVGRIAPGLEARISVAAFPGESFTGTIRDVRAAPQTVQNVVTYTAVIDAPNPDRKLRQGMTASVNVVTARHEGVLRVPNGALRFKPEGMDSPAKADGDHRGRKLRGEGEGAAKGRAATVWRLRAGALEPVAVRLGLSDGRFTELVEGPVEGDKVVVGEAGAKSASGSPGGPGGPRRGPF